MTRQELIINAVIISLATYPVLFLSIGHGARANEALFTGVLP